MDQFSTDPAQYRQRLAQALIGQGMSTAPVGHWLEGVGRMAQGAVGAQLAHQSGLNPLDVARGQAMANTFQNTIGAAGTGAAAPAWQPVLAAMRRRFYNEEA